MRSAELQNYKSFKCWNIIVPMSSISTYYRFTLAVLQQRNLHYPHNLHER